MESLHRKSTYECPVYQVVGYEALDLSPGNVRLLAGLGGALVAWKTKNVLWMIVVGMVLFWALQWV